jgi:hypothetical protein
MITTYDLLASHPSLSGIAEERLVKLSTWARRSLTRRFMSVVVERLQATRIRLLDGAPHGSRAP